MEGALRRFEDLRRAGAAALDLAWTAGAGLVPEVGGVVTDWSDGDDWIECGNILAASPAVHEALLELAAKAPDR